MSQNAKGIDIAGDFYIENSCALVISYADFTAYYVRDVWIQTDWNSNWKATVPFLFTSFTYFVISSLVISSLKTTMYRLECHWMACDCE